jgi:hypothetical protein
MSKSPKHVRFGPTNVPDFTKKQHYPSILCIFTILSVLGLGLGLGLGFRVRVKVRVFSVEWSQRKSQRPE